MRPAAPGTSHWPAEPAVGAVGRQLPPRLQLLVALLSVVAGSADMISFGAGRPVRRVRRATAARPVERFKVTYSCQLPRSFWIHAKQDAPGPITCEICDRDFQRQNADHQDQGK